ncbi:MAG: DUF2059 domain-containing protein [Bacteroidota bacterium]
MRYALFFFFSLSTLSLIAQDKTTPPQDEFSHALQQYLDLSGARTQFDVVINQLIDMQRDAYAGVSTAFWDEFSVEIQARGFEEIVRLMEPIYREHFTQGELDALVTFYSSDIGRSIASKTPIVTQESMQVGAEWGATLATEITQRLNEAESSGKIQRH